MQEQIQHFFLKLLAPMPVQRSSMLKYTNLLKTAELKLNVFFCTAKIIEAYAPFLEKTFNKPPVNIITDNILVYLSYNM